LRLQLDGRSCIVTGASRGIGRATAELLSRDRARVMLVARGGDELEQVAERCRALGTDAVAVALDVTAPGAAQQLAERCMRHFGTIDVLVNNAGTSSVADLSELADEDWYAQWKINVIAPMSLTRTVAPIMASAGGGNVVNVCSSAGRRPSGTNAAYSVTKAAELALTKALAREYEAERVRINAVAPGPTASELWLSAGGLLDQVAARDAQSRDDALRAVAERIPVKRFATPEEVAAVIALLCTDDLAPSGAVWPVDGGHVATTIS
jgi:3-oxoacyl-[acyl-carrier protein] reductase